MKRMRILAESRAPDSYSADLRLRLGLAPADDEAAGQPANGARMT